MWSHRKAGLGLVSSLMVVAGTAAPVMAQDEPAPQPQEEPELPPGRGANDPEEDVRQRIENAARLRDRLRQQRIDRQREEAEGALEVPEEAQPVAESLEPGPAEGQISLVFEGPVDLSAFVEFVAQTLKINIIEDQGLAGKSVVFRAPMTIPREELLPLLQALIEDSGFALVYDDLGFFRIRAEAGIQPDFAGGAFATTRIIRTPLIRPSIAAQTLTQQIGGGTAPGGATGGLTFRITPIDELGILIATGPSGTLDMIERFTDELVSQSKGQRFIRLELRNVSASYARSRVIALNAGAGAPSAGVGALGAGGNQPVPASTTGLLGNLESRLYVDQGNALLFRGSEEEASLVRDMIDVLDEVTPLIVRRYVAGSVAMEAASAGERLGLGNVTITGDSNTTGSYRGGGQTLAPTGTRMQGDQSVEPAASGFTVDTSTGSLIYYGTESQHERVQLLVEQFKLTAIGEDIEIKTYKLLYAKAEGEEDGAAGVVDILNELLEDPGNQTTQSRFLPGSQGRQSDEQNSAQFIEINESAPPTEGATRLLATQENTIIVADPARNQIIIKAPRKAQEQFAEIIAKLDEKQPQVMIEVQIVSVTTTDAFNWEADVQLNFGQFSWFSGFGASIVEGTAAVGATTLDPRTLPATTPGLTTGWIKSDYLPIAIQTLQTIGDTRVLSKPSILVNDNQEANFESVRTEPYSAASQSSSTTIVSQGGTVDAGTTLTVTPRISAGGDITVDFQVELSDFTGAGSDGLQPPKQTESYESYVTLPSDSTIVVGGFKLKRDAKTENKIPVLGDIPLIGALFKNYNKTERHATIYVFITPKVMRDALGEDLRLATRGPMAEMEIDPDVPAMEPSVIPIFGGLGPSIVPFTPPPATAASMSDAR